MKSWRPGVWLLLLSPLFLVMVHPVAGMALAAVLMVLLLIPGIRQRVL